MEKTTTNPKLLLIVNLAIHINTLDQMLSLANALITNIKRNICVK